MYGAEVAVGSEGALDLEGDGDTRMVEGCLVKGEEAEIAEQLECRAEAQEALLQGSPWWITFYSPFLFPWWLRD